MHIKLFFCLFFLSFMTFAQNLKKRELIGTWKVKNVYEQKTDQSFKMGFQDVKAIFENAVFTFNKDSSSELHTNEEHLNAFFKDMYWYYNKKTSSVKLLKQGSHHSSSGMLKLSIKKYNNLVKFHIDNDVILTVKKQ